MGERANGVHSRVCRVHNGVESPVYVCIQACICENALTRLRGKVCIDMQPQVHCNEGNTCEARKILRRVPMPIVGGGTECVALHCIPVLFARSCSSYDHSPDIADHLLNDKAVARKTVEPDVVSDEFAASLPGHRQNTAPRLKDVYTTG